ncbi:MAG TPA: hypothetical protein VJ742_03795 [Nitrososphaera sp.]|nr:hypothetical protein [Nitrososphaera sp.]
MNAMSEGPRVLWEQLKGKKVKSNDGKELGEIKEVSQNYVRIERGTLKKEKFWVPKYLADVYDGKSLWLLIDSNEATGAYLYGTEPQEDRYTHDFEEFRTTPYGQRAVYLPDLDQNVRLDETERRQPSDEYKNIRDPS